MPSNPQVPREVAEAKGKGAARLAVLGISLAAIGLAAVLVGVSVASSGSGSNSRSQPVADTGPVQTAVATQQGNYPICGDAKDVFFDPDHCVRLVKVKMRPECWSGWISTPLDWGWESETHPDRPLDMLFLDGTRVFLTDNARRFDDKRGVFRVRGDGEFAIKIVDGPMERAQKRNYAAALQSGRPPEPVYRNGADALIGRPYTDPCRESGVTTLAAQSASTGSSAEPIQGEIVTIVATNFLENFMTVSSEKGERNINPHNNPLYVKTPSGGWQNAMWWHLPAGSTIRLVWNGDELKRMELVENVRALPRANSESENSSRPASTRADVTRDARDRRVDDAIPLLLVGTVLAKSDDSLRLHVNDTGAEVEVRNVRDLPVNYRGDTYRIRNLEVGDEVRLSYFPTTQVVGVPSNIARPVRIEVLRSANR